MLSTPPAFILSQDQTLMFKSFFQVQSFPSGLLFLFGLWLLSLVCSLKFFLEFSGLHYCLFVKVQAKRGFVQEHFWKLAYIKCFLCKDPLCDSTQRANLFASRLCVLQASLFRADLTFVVVVFSGNSVILSRVFRFVNNFFKLFSKLFQVLSTA